MLLIIITDDVLKLLKSNDIKLLQYLNILYILVTDNVFKLLKFNDIKLEQL